MYVICGSQIKEKITSRGNKFPGYVLFLLDKSKREGVKGITSTTIWIKTDQYIEFDIDKHIDNADIVNVIFNRYGYVEKIENAK